MSRRACKIELIDPSIDSSFDGGPLIPTILKINGHQVDWVSDSGFKVDEGSFEDGPTAITFTLFPGEFTIRGREYGEGLDQ